MSYYIYSTLASDMNYATYSTKPEDLRRDIAKPIKEILIAGKANVANKHFVTPRGMVTKISDEDFGLLKENYHFKEHVRLGYVTSEKKQLEVDKVITGMNARDVSAPITPAFYEKASPGMPKPIGLRRS